MRMWNADGSESEMCGNGLRCAAKLAFDHQRLPGTERQRTHWRRDLHVKSVTAIKKSATCASNMGAPRLIPSEIPAARALPNGDTPLQTTITLPAHGDWLLYPVGMGNPHAVTFVDNAEAAPCINAGPRLSITNTSPTAPTLNSSPPC